MESKRIKRHLDRLLLDPNNYRFIDKNEYVFVPDDKLDDPRIQLRTRNFIQGPKNANIVDLIDSFKTNGFLDIEQIQVKPVGENYLVLEGNRRITTLKLLYDEFKLGNDIGKLEESDFKSIDLVVIMDEDPVQHLITMGLHHISGKKRWSAVNEAQLIEDLSTKYGKQEDEICSSLGISKTAYRRMNRTLALINAYKKSDYGDQFTQGMYSIFEAVISNPPLKAWLGWEDWRREATNKVSLERFFTWISKTEEVDRDNEKDQVKTLDPIITQYRQVKEVADFVSDAHALQRMEESRSISQAYAISTAVGETKLREAIDSITNGIQLAYNFRDLMDANLFDKIGVAKERLSDLLPESKALAFENEKRGTIYFKEIKTQFGELAISNYRKLATIKVKNLKRINLFAGGNNMGKTSILEAFYLLSQLNDIPAFLELEKYRGKFLSQFHSKWIEKNFVNPIELAGTFNGVGVALAIRKESSDENIERTGYLNTIVSEAQVEALELSSYVHLFSAKDPDYRYTQMRSLCRAAFTSPYRHNDKILQAAHNLAIEDQYFDRVIQFIRDHLDSSIQKIDLVNDEGEYRFKVTSSNSTLDRAIDITKYGEGLQRVFEIALLLGYCRNGILCIDEIDSAIHKSLLVKFTEFLQRTAAEFNVQVFLSTHSKECIDAFVENEYPDDDLMAYALSEENGNIVCKFLDGNKLKQLVESIDIDIR